MINRDGLEPCQQIEECLSGCEEIFLQLYGGTKDMLSCGEIVKCVSI